MLQKMLRKLLFVLGAAVIAAALIRPFVVTTEREEVVPAPVLPPPPKPVIIEKPLHNVTLPDFAAIVDVNQKKSAFFDFIRPAVESNNNAILADRTALEEMLVTVSLGEPLMPGQEQQLDVLASRYRVSKKGSQMQQLHHLLLKVDEIPTALVLVQAANESAWGTSRFARIGLNFFGIWCYKSGCGMVPRSRNSGAKHEVEAFQSVDEAVNRYLHNINTNNAYSVFRSIRQQLREQDQPLVPEVLAMGLLPYSERGSDYVLEISDMLRHNSQYLQSSTAP
ncbi:glucosaminidase domain-containing protein [Thalassotalea euphylliae]|nr:glucosaminidase domain-containing protein [Thalassotalea euphylliae]